MKVNELKSNGKHFIFYLSARYIRTTPWVGSYCYSKLQIGKQADRGSVFPKVASLVRSRTGLKARAFCLLTVPSGCPVWVCPSSSAGDCVLSVAVRRALSLPSSVILSSTALLHCCLWFQWHGFIWAVVRVIGVVKSPSGRCSLACQWRVASWSEGTGHVRGRGEQRGAWEDSGCILGKWLVEALIHRPGCAQDWVYGILTVCTPSTKLVPLKTVAGKSFPPWVYLGHEEIIF